MVSGTQRPAYVRIFNALETSAAHGLDDDVVAA